MVIRHTVGVTELAAVLWDMDGTLVDTEPYWIASEHQLVAEHGIAWSDADAHSLVGFDLLAAAHELRNRGGVTLEPPAVVEYLLASVIAALRRGPAVASWRPRAPRRVCRRRHPQCHGHDVVAVARGRRDRCRTGRFVHGVDHR